MKKTLLILFFGFANIVYSQTKYDEIKSEKIDNQKVQLSKNFIQNYLTQCNDKNYVGLSDFNLSTDFKKFLSENLKEICLSNNEKLGKITLKNLNSVYKNKSSLIGGNELYIFETNTEKKKDIKYVSVWVSKENQIDGIVITSYKPLKKRK